MLDFLFSTPDDLKNIFDKVVDTVFNLPQGHLSLHDIEYLLFLDSRILQTIICQSSSYTSVSFMFSVIVDNCGLVTLGGPPPSDFESREIYPRVEDNVYSLQLLLVYTRLFCVPSF